MIKFAFRSPRLVIEHFLVIQITQNFFQYPFLQYEFVVTIKSLDYKGQRLGLQLNNLIQEDLQV